MWTLTTHGRDEGVCASNAWKTEEILVNRIKSIVFRTTLLISEKERLRNKRNITHSLQINVYITHAITRLAVGKTINNICTLLCAYIIGVSVTLC